MVLHIDFARISGPISQSFIPNVDSDILLLKDILYNMKTSKYEYTTNRPYHLGECLLHKKARKIEDLNVFAEVKKSIDVNGDKKRFWMDSFNTGREVLRKQIYSLPITIGD